MEKTLIASGKNIEDAIASALNQLGLDRDSVSVMVLQQEKKGFLGFGAQPAKVQVSYEAPDPVPEKVEKPKSALGSASRSKPKAAAPVKKPEAPKAEAPKPQPKAEAPKAEPVKEAPKAPKAPKQEAPKPQKEHKPKAPRAPRLRLPRQSPRSSPLPNPAAWRRRSKSSSRASSSTWIPTLSPTPSRRTRTPTTLNWWAMIWAT